MIAAPDGPTALRLASEVKPHVVVTDLAMPRMDGFELIRQFRRAADTKHVPIIALTAQGGGDTNTQARKAGCDVVLSKPCAPETLVTAVLAFVGDGRSKGRRRRTEPRKSEPERRKVDRRRSFPRNLT